MSTFTERLGRVFGREVIGLLGLFALTVIAFSLTSPQFLSIGNFDSIGFQLPDLGLLTLAMLAPIIANGINLAVIATANLSGLTLAWISQHEWRPERRRPGFRRRRRRGAGRPAARLARPWAWSSPILARIRSSRRSR